MRNIQPLYTGRPVGNDMIDQLGFCAANGNEVLMACEKVHDKGGV